MIHSNVPEQEVWIQTKLGKCMTKKLLLRFFFYEFSSNKIWKSTAKTYYVFKNRVNCPYINKYKVVLKICLQDQI